ncbi:MAG: pyrrolysine--tRNA(Pyl) ligase large subunit [Desulfobacterales bacterium]
MPTQAASNPESMSWSQVQLRRLRELNAEPQVLKRKFIHGPQREQAFQELETALVKQARQGLEALRTQGMRPRLVRLEGHLSRLLTDLGFVQVATPILMSRGLLAKMTIDEAHPLYEQVFWVDAKRCLRPMLAPHLYYILKDLLRLWPKPVKIFEVGPCFRKESAGSQHAEEFTMLNLTEFGLPEDQRHSRISELADRIAHAAGLKDYRVVTENSAVYGDTLDIEAGVRHLEVGSAAMGPHPLDRPWRIRETWIGIGFGLERLILATEGYSHLAMAGRSLAYLDGFRLNL